MTALSAVVASPLSPREVNSTNKAGLAWGGGDSSSMEQFLETGKVQWYYTWSPKTYIWQPPSGIEYVPMLWGNRQLDEWKATINDTLKAGGVTKILGMNEPQETGQSNMTPKEGAEMWKEYINPLLNEYPDLELGSPAPSGAPSGKEWLLDFLDECDGCTVDFIACHWYDINATDFIEYMEDFHETFKRPIAVTEWSCQNFNTDDQCTEDEVVDFLNTTQTWMDNTDWIKMYAYFGSLTSMAGVNEENRLMNADAKITTLGRQYIGANGSGYEEPSDDGGSSDSGSAIRNPESMAWILRFIVFLQFSVLLAA
ncbi:glycoside hydrolase family 128 protein [Cylindrobasidium torrendii FP15055 ss-10]|uniref:Glycoside hydrolase family 128 protein n=1 Tax=Cylindrobasidium torrendii FP15055 ss-10 TaxID=1314674 RepID=A0A0D7AUW7_9AGAR|nr:glycoside hydrolase family 128 protein [Cylindrobasidium torrendii FP15055 ss-10]